jgi:hypothetical protein
MATALTVHTLVIPQVDSLARGALRVEILVRSTATTHIIYCILPHHILGVVTKRACKPSEQSITKINE